MRPLLVLAWLVLALFQEFRGGFAWGAAACVAMFFSGVTDAFDGHLARKWNVVSQFGKMADPLMDKIFYVVAFPSLCWLSAHGGESAVHSVSLLVFAIFYIVRDLWVTFMRSIGALYGADGAAMPLGKIRTALSFPVAGFIYLHLYLRSALPDGLPAGTLAACLVLETAMTVLNAASFASYTKAYLPYLKKTAHVSKAA